MLIRHSLWFVVVSALLLASVPSQESFCLAQGKKQSSKQLNKKIDEFRDADKKGSERWEREREAREKDRLNRLQYAHLVMFSKIHRATTDDYIKWLEGYMKKGGKPTHCYGYPMGRHDWYIAQKDFELVPLYGADAVFIIVPANIKMTGDDRGHNELFFMKDFSHEGIVPIYGDTKF